MKRLLANVIERLPGHWPLTILDQLRRLRYPKVREAHRLHQAIFQKIGAPTRVMQGPFQGLNYLPRGYFGYLLPKMLATYEMELNPQIERIIAAKPDLIVDIGAAEGYYAVGLAKRNEQGRMVCYEIYEPAQRLIADLAARNGVADRVTIYGMGTAESLNQCLNGARLAAVMCDIEGAEDQLLDPNQIPALTRSILLIEVHEIYVAGLLPRLTARFEPSHEIEVIRSRVKTDADLPAGVTLRSDELIAATDEGRAEATWIYCTPKSA